MHSRKKHKNFHFLPILFGSVIGVASMVMLIANPTNSHKTFSNPNSPTIYPNSSSVTTNVPKTNRLATKHKNETLNLYQEIIGLTITAPDEKGYFPKEWKWKIEKDEVLYVEELDRKEDEFGYLVITLMANLHRGNVKVNAKMRLKYNISNYGRQLASYRTTKLIIPEQKDYSHYVELHMDYDFLPALMLYNRSNMTLFVGGDYSSKDETSLFSAIVEPHSSEMIVMGSIQYYHVHFAYEK